MPNLYHDYYNLEPREISSTYEGRHVTLPAELINSPTGGGVVVAKDPVTFGTVSDGWGVGVAFNAGTATDQISIDTEGIWCLDVVAVDDAGNSAVRIGDPIFINRTTCVLSKMRNQATHIPFGYALDTIDTGVTAGIAVKVHWDLHDLVVGMWSTVTSGSFGWSFRGVLTDGQSEGVGGYVQGDLYGTATDNTYGFGSWLNLQAGYDAANAGYTHAPFEGGIWSADAQPLMYASYAGQYHAILAGQPSNLYAWRLNSTHRVDALIQAANLEAVGYVAGVATLSNKVGDLPLAEIAAGVGVRWVRLYDAAG
jgi:hypothetical protein